MARHKVRDSYGKSLLLAAILVGLAATCRADDGAAKLAIDFDATYVSKYIWRGYDLFDDHAALQPSVNLDLFGSGFSANVWGSIPMGSSSNRHHGLEVTDGINILQEYDYTIAYNTSLFQDQFYALDLGVNYIYYDFPKVNSMLVPDTQEIGISAALPNLIKIGDTALVPSYYGGKLWPSDSHLGFDVAGGYHSFALGCDLPIPETAYALSLSADINYNDGMFGSDHDWSHATLGISTSVPVGRVTFTPFLSYQISMDESVNYEEELYGGLSVSVSF